MHGFALWLKAELDAMTARLGKSVRPLFLMRDGHLPMRVFEALYPDAGAAPVELSRFVRHPRQPSRRGRGSTTISANGLHRLPLKVLARQLMLFEHEVARPLKLGDTEAGREAFAARAALGRAAP